MTIYITGTKPLCNVMCLLVVFTVATFIGAIQADAAVDENTVAVWLFEEGAGQVVKDASGNGNHGTFAGNPKWVKGKFGTGLEFPGDSSGSVSLLLQLRNPLTFWSPSGILAGAVLPLPPSGLIQKPLPFPATI